MRRLRRQITIAAPAADIWRVVHVEIAEVPRWCPQFVRTEVVGGGPLTEGGELRYVVRLPGGLAQNLHLHVERLQPHRLCAGTMRGPGLTGHWVWRYREHGAATTVTYEVAAEPRGVLRLAAPALYGQIRDSVAENLHTLKRYVEGAKR